MNYRIDTPMELKALLRALRKARGLNQAQAGVLIGVSQRRMAAIEARPSSTAFDQISRLVLALGGRLAITLPDDGAVAEKQAPVPGVHVARTKRSLAKDTW